MRAALVLFALVVVPADAPAVAGSRGLSASPVAQSPAQSNAARLADLRRAALARDPATLPRAATGRWHDFDPRGLVPESVPREFHAAHEALAVGDLPAALAALHATVEREPDFPPALHQLGVVYFRLQRYGDARTCFERYLVAVPGRVADTRGLAHALYSLGDYARARAHYERVIAAAPDDVEAARGLALTLYREGDLAGALVRLDAVIVREPGHADAWTWKALVLLDLEKPADARAAAEKARDLAPWSPRPWFALATALADLGRDADSRAAHERFQLLSRADQEIRRLEARLEYEPGDFESRRALAMVLADVGHRAAVRTQLARLAADRPSDVPTRVLVLDVLDRLGDTEAASLAARDLERVGAESVAAWKRLEIWHAARKDRLKQIEAGERWRRASQP